MSQNSLPTMFCYAHPQRETLLRCNQCDRPMCTSCAVRTPTGYRCKDCVKGQQKIFDTALWWDYPLAVVVSGVLSWLGSLLVSFTGFFTLFLAPFIGMVIAEAVRRALHKRRSRQLPIVSAFASLAGALISPVSSLIFMVFAWNQGLLQGSITGFLSFLWPVVYGIVVASAVYYRLKGIRV